MKGIHKIHPPFIIYFTDNANSETVSDVISHLDHRPRNFSPDRPITNILENLHAYIISSVGGGRGPGCCCCPSGACWEVALQVQCLEVFRDSEDDVN